MQNYQLPDGKVLILRSCKPDMTSYNGFKWPESGPVECPDWEDNDECGNGMHGWLWATGNFGLKYKEPGAKWLAVEVDADSVRNLDNEKVKFPKGNVVLTGNFRQAYDLVMKWFWLRHAVDVKAIATGDKEHAACDSGHASATGDYGHASATGYSGHASATGDSGHASATGYSGHASATGYYGHASATGKYGHASATGKYGHASATGYSGHASATGYSGHASATGDSGHASATGKYGSACILGQSGKAKCGEDGSIILTYWDGNRLRHKIGYDGENGIKRDTWYCLNGNNEFEETVVEE